MQPIQLLDLLIALYFIYCGILLHFNPLPPEHYLGLPEGINGNVITIGCCLFMAGVLFANIGAIHG